MIFEDDVWGLLGLCFDMLKLAVKIVKLEHQEVRLELVEVVLRCQVDWEVELVLDLDYIIQI